MSKLKDTPSQMDFSLPSIARKGSSHKHVHGCSHVSAIKNDHHFRAYRTVLAYALRYRYRQYFLPYRKPPAEHSPSAKSMKPPSNSRSPAKESGPPVKALSDALSKVVTACLQLPLPSCHKCHTPEDRLHACLHCVYMGCWLNAEQDHIRPHLTANEHVFAVDFLYGTLYCSLCTDYIYDHDFEALLQEEVTHMQDFLNQLQDGRAPNIIFSHWKPDQDELKLIEQNAKVQSHLGLRGMRNLGSTCFMNVILQCFIHNPPLRAYFLSDKHSPYRCTNDHATCLACQMDKIFTKFYSGHVSPFAPNEFLWAMWMSCSQLIGYAQQDAHEFFIGALDGLHNSLEKAMNAETQVYTRSHPHDCPCIVHRIFAGTFDSTVTCLSCGNETHAFDPFLDISLDVRPVLTPHLFGMENMDSPIGASATQPIDLTLTAPPMSSAEPFQTGKGRRGQGTPPKKNSPEQTKTKSSASSPVPKPGVIKIDCRPVNHDLYECLDKFTHQERLSPSEYKCSRCYDAQGNDSSSKSVRLGAVKQLSLKKLPLVLCMQLKRFDHRFTAGNVASTNTTSNIGGASEDNSAKINQMIHFPLDLDLSRYTTFGVKSENLKEKQKHRSRPSSPVNERPSAIQRHKASPDSNSSYTYTLFAVIVHHGTLHSGHYTCYIRQSGGTNQWFRFNDHMVFLVDWAEVSKCQAYMCFYIKKNFEYEQKV